MVSKSNPMNIFDEIERDYDLSLGDSTLEIMLVFSAKTRKRAEALQAPGQLVIIEISDLMPRLLKGLPCRLQFRICRGLPCTVCFSVTGSAACRTRLMPFFYDLINVSSTESGKTSLFSDPANRLKPKPS